MQDYYSTLELPFGASIHDVKAAFRRLAKIHHPDKGGDKEAFEKIYNAYTNLSNPERSCNSYAYPDFESTIKKLNELLIVFKELQETLNSIIKAFTSNEKPEYKDANQTTPKNSESEVGETLISV